MADEEKKVGSSENILHFEKERHKKRALERLKYYLDSGYGKEYARKLAILEVKLEIKNEQISEITKRINAENARYSLNTTTSSDKNYIKIEISNLKTAADKLEEEKKPIEEEKNDILTNYGTKPEKLQDEMKAELDELENVKSYLEESEYEGQKANIEKRYREVLSGKKKEPGKGYPLVSTKREHAKRLFRGRWPWPLNKVLKGTPPKALYFKRPCPKCQKKTLVEYVNEKTGSIYYKCSNPVCLEVGREWTPDEVGIGYKTPPEGIDVGRYKVLKGTDIGRKTPILGFNARERANKRLAFEKRLEPIQKKYGKGEIDDEEYQGQKDILEGEIYGLCPLCNGKLKGDIDPKTNNVYFRCTNPTCSNCTKSINANAIKKYKKGFVTRAGGPLNKLAKKGGEEVLHAFIAACIVGLGALVSAIFGNMWFFFGFLSVSINFLVPSPDKGEFEKVPLGWGHILPWAHGGSHAGFAWAKSITKVAAIICFAYGFKSMGDIFNAFFIITCLVGYFSLKLTYSPDRPGDFIESLLRFGILGCYFIPFVVFAGIFNSYVLAAIAFAFFAIPPMPETSKGQDLTEILARGLSGQTAYYEMFDKILFIGLMVFALIASGSLGGVADFLNLGWQLTGTLKYTFVYFWVVSLIGGFFSPARERPLTGMLFLGGATIIYGIGPGSQDIGSALLGQWWPTVNENVMAIADPIGKMFGQLGKTFGDAFLLLTNPVGYATQLMNGSYSNNPVGETGAYGIELSQFEVSPVFIEQPFMITTNVKNTGAYVAEGVSISLSMGIKSPESQGGVSLPVLGEKTPTIAATKTGTSKMKISQTGIDMTKCETQKEIWWQIFDVWKDDTCVHVYNTEPNSGTNPLTIDFTRQNIWQTVFSSSGISCSVSNTYELRKKSIPVNITLNYRYHSDSKVPVEFISQAEWDRLARLDQLGQKLTFVKSEYSSAPVKFPIGTPGLKNPILETQDFHIALNIMSDQTGGRINSIEKIVLNYPADFDLASDKCSPAFDGKEPVISPDGQTKTITWSNKKSGDQIFFCHFNALKTKNANKLGGSPTKTYIVTAHADYLYSRSQEKLVKVEFGSWCCTQEPIKDSCASDQQCCPEDKKSGKGICIPNGQNC